MPSYAYADFLPRLHDITPMLIIFFTLYYAADIRLPDVDADVAATHTFTLYLARRDTMPKACDAMRV